MLAETVDQQIVRQGKGPAREVAMREPGGIWNRRHEIEHAERDKRTGGAIPGLLILLARATWHVGGHVRTRHLPHVGSHQLRCRRWRSQWRNGQPHRHQNGKQKLEQLANTHVVTLPQELGTEKGLPVHKFAGEGLAVHWNGKSPTDLPDGLIFRNRVKPLAEKYFSLSEAKITCMSCPSRAEAEGRIAIVTKRGAGMRWTRWPGLTNSADADGEIAWSWRPDAGVKSAGDEPAGDGG